MKGQTSLRTPTEQLPPERCANKYIFVSELSMYCDKLHYLTLRFGVSRAWGDPSQRGQEVGGRKFGVQRRRLIGSSGSLLCSRPATKARTGKLSCQLPGASVSSKPQPGCDRHSLPGTAYGLPGPAEPAGHSYFRLAPQRRPRRSPRCRRHVRARGTRRALH